MMAAFTDGIGGDLLDGLSFSFQTTANYDTNPYQGVGSAGGKSGGDFYVSIGGSASYQSKARAWTVGASYSGGYNQFFEFSELGGYYQDASGFLRYQGGPLTATLSLGVDFGSGSNRDYASVVDELSVNVGLSTSYRISPKASVDADFSQSVRTVSGSGNSGTDSFNAGLAAMWRYSGRTRIGPGVRYTRQGGDNQAGRESIGPTVNVNYRLTGKVSLNSRVGWEFVDYEDGGSTDPLLSASLGVNYQASSLWGLNLSYLRDARAETSGFGGYTETNSLRVGYHRRIRRAVWNLGASYQTDSPSESGSGTTGRGERDYLNFDTSLSMPFWGRNTANIYADYRDQSGSGSDSWDALRFGVGLSRSF